MLTIPLAVLDKKKAKFASMRLTRQPFWSVWRDLADYFMPMRCTWLMSNVERTTNRNNMTNPMILDSTGTQAARTLAAGLMNGIASPSRPWFRLRLKDFGDDISREARVWLDEVERRLRFIIGESNFYNALAVFFLDLAVFGTASFTIFEDKEKLIHCQNHALGEYYIDLDNRLRPCVFGREFNYTVQQIVMEFGEENVSANTLRLYKEGGARLLDMIHVSYMLEPNLDKSNVPRSMEYREYYWEDSTDVPGQILREKGYTEKPNIVARWEVAGNDAYGTSPGMDNLGDVKQLQHEVKKKAQAMDKMVSPPLLADVMLENKPLALLPNGVTFVPRLDATNGAKPIYTVNPPIGEMTADLGIIGQRIRDGFYNFLFNKVTSLPTVRSAREIDAIEGEKLVLLGSFLERVENEGLDPGLSRIFNIASRKGAFPPAPQEIAGRELEVQYVSIIAAAQSAAGTAAFERFVQFGGNLVGVWPEVREVPEITDAYMDYGRDLGVSAKHIRSRKMIADIIAQRSQAQQQDQQQVAANQSAQTAELLSKTDVGGGANLLQRMISGPAGA